MHKDKDKSAFNWLRLDNAAKIYPAIIDPELTAVFRVGVELKERVKIAPLLSAIKSLEQRFPFYKVRLKAGVFWYYLEPLDRAIPVRPDQGLPCRAFGKQELMFRVQVKDNKISVEFSHILTDGTGAFEFLKAVLLAYFSACGMTLTGTPPYIRAGDAPREEEYEDAYKRYFRPLDLPSFKIPGAFHVPFALNRRPRFDVLTAILPVKAVIQKAKTAGVSLTVYLTAVYLWALQSLHDGLSPLRQRTSRKILRIQVPVNLRKLFPSRTLRNFSLYIMPGIDLRLGMYSFEEIIKTVSHQIALETDEKLIGKMISRNVGGEKHFLIRRVPLFIKSWVLAKLYATGTKQYSGVVTNLGNIDLGPETNRLINKFVFIPPPPNKILKANCGVVGFGDELIMSFGNITLSRDLERNFLTFLTAEGIPVRIENVFKR